MADPLMLSTVQVRRNDRWEAVAVIDGRRYADRAGFDEAVLDAFDTLDDLEIPAQLEREEIRPDEPASRLPFWEDYKVMLATKGAGGTA
ncbi:hypothetical protein [Kribbella italica]|uniref:Uncharacterized protein n=1 Tax=Kribbella italica TaxID=1540520 RepID=A0A7W9MTD7_9ACTN|nr:hypothetical protein [Kribbella italica]MBB5835020.1 hypothetical protein [Kribbella italica]